MRANPKPPDPEDCVLCNVRGAGCPFHGTGSR
jgi:hypothetical protein